ncbi:hypothetical protein [Sorangium sp. So ce363]|uniref:hypothetical protein n=1 Tax=Sorangium sp. So ce363 TaxID=3133304 RepID=UPI003F617817
MALSLVRSHPGSEGSSPASSCSTPERLALHERLLTQAMAEAAERQMLKTSGGRRPYSATIDKRLPEFEDMLKYAPWPRLSQR